MPEPGTSLVAKVAVEIVKTAVEAGLLEKIIDAFRKKHRVIVLGSSGVGKTNLRLSLTQEAAEAVDQLNRTEVVARSHIRIEKKPFVFTDTPGQDYHEQRRKTATREEMGRGKPGIINVVSYGYHEGAGSKSAAIDENGKPRLEYLTQCRDREIEALKEWTSLLGSVDTSAWLITVVNKADLWWHQREEVIKYYTHGDYAQKLGDAKSLKQIVIPYSSTMHKFFGEGSMSGTFDRNDQMKCKVRLLSALMSLVTESE